MRCEECGRPMKNAELWRLATDPNAPTSRSMRQMCWECRERRGASATADDSGSRYVSPVVAEASEVAARYAASIDG
ncbi:MAG TPA: hypothetical protein VF510_01135 [Ktedonobacterales bacterium]